MKFLQELFFPWLTIIKEVDNEINYVQLNNWGLANNEIEYNKVMRKLNKL